MSPAPLGAMVVYSMPPLQCRRKRTRLELALSAEPQTSFLVLLTAGRAVGAGAKRARENWPKKSWIFLDAAASNSG